MEQRLTGKGVSEGIAIGKVHWMSGNGRSPKNTHAPLRPEEELTRFRTAQAEAARTLCALAEKTRREVGEEAAALFDTHTELLSDPDFEAVILSAIENGASAEAAVKTAGEQFSALFSAMEDEYLRERAQDVLDVAERLQTALSGEEVCPEPDAPYILASEQLTPSQTVSLSRDMLLGIALKNGSSNDHTAILARLLGIPAVFGLGDDLSPEMDGKPAVLDGTNGIFLSEPDDITAVSYRQSAEAEKAERAALEDVRGKPDETGSGQTLDIFCSIGSPTETAAVLENDGRGIGLFRSEFLFLGRDTLPDEETQFIAYRSVLCGMGSRPVTIRTADIGADKPLPALQQNPEQNPALGCRGIRLGLSEPAFLRTQLRALYRASAFGNLRILLPMISNVWEVQEVQAVCASVRAELEGDGLPMAEHVPLGVMIETPAAALLSQELARTVDFFSIGTNDLTQYTTACDRQDGRLSRHAPPHHAAVLSLIQMSADSARDAKIPAGICGELGGDASLLPFFLRIGISEVSVPPRDVLPLRVRLRSL